MATTKRPFKLEGGIYGRSSKIFDAEHRRTCSECGSAPVRLEEVGNYDCIYRCVVWGHVCSEYCMMARTKRVARENSFYKGIITKPFY